jgi:CxxC-x17-CxxC domain-containing protein
MTYTDETLACADCGADFPFTAGEAVYYSERGFSKPRRCHDCRAARRAQDPDAPQRPELYSATCAECNAVARVPFQPRGDRAVFCSRCFQAIRHR